GRTAALGPGIRDPARQEHPGGFARCRDGSVVFLRAGYLRRVRDPGDFRRPGAPGFCAYARRTGRQYHHDDLLRGQQERAAGAGSVRPSYAGSNPAALQTSRVSDCVSAAINAVAVARPPLDKATPASYVVSLPSGDGSGPTTRAPGIGSISLMKVMPMSACPSATRWVTSAPLAQRKVLRS